MINKVEIELARKNGTLELLQDKLVTKLIRNKYTLSQELAAVRQRDTKPEKFKEFSDFADKCIAEVNELLGIEKTK